MKCDKCGEFYYIEDSIPNIFVYWTNDVFKLCDICASMIMRLIEAGKEED
jgi:hypothetical protein